MKYKSKIINILIVAVTFLCITIPASCQKGLLPTDYFENLSQPKNNTDKHDAFLHDLSKQVKNQIPLKYSNYKDIIARQIEVHCGFIADDINTLDYKLSKEDTDFIFYTVAEVVYNVNLNVLDANIPLAYLENLPYNAAYKTFDIILDELKKQTPKDKIKEIVKEKVKKSYQDDLRSLQEKYPVISGTRFTKEMLKSAIKLSDENYYALTFSNMSNEKEPNAKTVKDALKLPSVQTGEYTKFALYDNGLKKDFQGRVSGRIMQGYHDGFDDVIGWEEYEYDKQGDNQGRIVSVKRKGYGQYPDGSCVWNFVYDKNNRVVKSNDNDYHSKYETTYEYDSQGLLAKKVRKNVTSKYTRDEVITYIYFYDEKNRLSSLMVENTATLDPYVEKITLHYDRRGNLTKKESYKFVQKGTIITIDKFKNNRLIESRNPIYPDDPKRDAVIEYEYHENGLPKMIVKTVPGDTQTQKTYRYFNPDGERVYELTLTFDNETKLLKYSNDYGCSVRLIQGGKLYRYDENLELDSVIDF